jgi:hypothetical protein
MSLEQAPSVAEGAENARKIPLGIMDTWNPAFQSNSLLEMKPILVEERLRPEECRGRESAQGRLGRALA